MSEPSCSVVIVNLDGQAYLGKCLDSFLQLRCPGREIEIVVVDNGSTDNTHHVVSHFVAQHAHMRLLTNPVRGIGPSRNFGLRHAIHPLLAFTDADCAPQPDWLQSLTIAYQEEWTKDPQVIAVGGSNIAPTNPNRFRRAIEIMSSTFWGHHGSVQAMVLGERSVVDHLPT